MPRIIVFLLIVAFCGALDVAMHWVWRDLTPMPPEFSALVNRFGFPMVAMGWIALVFIGMGLVFLFWAGRMSGSGWYKGLRYGLALGLMIQIAFFESIGLLGSPLFSVSLYGLADSVPIALLVALLGWTLAADSMNRQGHYGLPVSRVLVVFSLFYGVGRIGAQMLGLFESGLAERPLPSLIQPFAMGAAVGVLFLALTDVLRGLSRGGAALTFGVGIFGANWVMFMSFPMIVYHDALFDTLLRVVFDTALVIGAVLILSGRNYRNTAPVGS